MSEKGLGDNPNLLRVPRELVEEAQTEGFDPDELHELVRHLPKFARTFFQTFFDEELGIEITGMSDHERKLASNLAVEYEEDRAKAATVPLLQIFVDFCDLYIEYEELSTQEQASLHQAEILELTTRLLEGISRWAKASGHVVLSGMAMDVARGTAALA